MMPKALDGSGWLAGWIGVLCSDCGKGGGRWKGDMMIPVNQEMGVSSEWLEPWVWDFHEGVLRTNH